jgi:hypothetical protein
MAWAADKRAKSQHHEQARPELARQLLRLSRIFLPSFLLERVRDPENRAGGNGAVNRQI